jgi:hypothetical protein
MVFVSHHIRPGHWCKKIRGKLVRPAHGQLARSARHEVGPRLFSADELGRILDVAVQADATQAAGYSPALSDTSRANPAQSKSSRPFATVAVSRS